MKSRFIYDEEDTYCLASTVWRRHNN